MLTPLQVRLAGIVTALPEVRGFALAGAGGLLVHGLIDRETRDLVYFTAPGQDTAVTELREALENALGAAGLSHRRQRDLPTFVRIAVGDGQDRCEIDLAVDYRALEVETSTYGPTLAIEELAANKVLALFDRAEARDFLDLVALEIEDRVRTAAGLPWSREIYVDEDGGYLARVPELPGCFADGDTAEEAQASLKGVVEDWLAIAFERGERIPAPRQLADQYSGRFSVRIPRSLHASLSERAETEGCSLNQLVTTVLASDSRGGAVTPLGENAHEDLAEDAHEDLAAAAVGRDDSAIGALKGIGTFARKQGQVNLASLLYAKAASVIAERQGSEAAARELGVAASFARRDRRNQMAEALLRESLRHDLTNLRSASMLGQLLYFKGDYDEAVPYLERAAFVDNYAKTFLGWSMLLGGLETEDDLTRSQGLTHVDGALRKWAFGNGDLSDRASWLRQVRRLAALGEEYRELSVHLIAFASANANWGPMNAELLAESTDGRHETFNERTELG